MLLRVTPSLGPVFQAEAKTIVSRLNAALVQPGVKAEVKYDPLNMKRIQILSIDAASQPAAPAATPSVADRVSELDELKRRGLISETEYTAQKRG